MKLSVSVTEAVEMSGISRSGLYRLFKEGKIKPRKNGGQTLVLVEDLRSYLTNLPMA